MYAPSKLSGWPKYESYRAPQRFTEIAGMLGLPADSPAEAVEALATAIERLRTAVGIESSFAQLGVDEKAFFAALPQQSINAYEDQCAPANPRAPMLEDMQQIMVAAYHGAGAVLPGRRPGAGSTRRLTAESPSAAR